jgi:hypothetical protein
MSNDDPLSAARGLLNGLTLSFALWYALWIAVA